MQHRFESLVVSVQHAVTLWVVHARYAVLIWSNTRDVKIVKIVIVKNLSKALVTALAVIFRRRISSGLLQENEENDQ